MRVFDREPGSWAVRASFEEIANHITSEFETTKNMILERKVSGLTYQRLLRRLVYLSVLLIQLRNGCRVGEAVEALSKFVETGESEVYVRVEKKRGERVMRKIFRPKNLTDEVLDLLRGVEVRKELVKDWASHRFGINTHAIRHAFITYLVTEKDINPAIVARIIEWGNLNMLLKYIAKREAENVLKSLDF